MKEKEMWNLYVQSNQLGDKTYAAWSFGGDDKTANELAELVVNGIKTATASGYQLYEIENSPLPPVGGLNIILDANQNAVCITETTKVYTCPFVEVSEEQAFKEGEGDRSLSFWRKVHWDVFLKEYKENGLEFSEDALVVCEEFKVVYK